MTISLIFCLIVVALLVGCVFALVAVIRRMQTLQTEMAERVNGATRIVTEKEIYRMNISLTELMDKLPKDRFMRSHRSYIINISDIARLTQYGRWTYTIGFKGTAETALMTYENYEIIKGRFF